MKADEYKIQDVFHSGGSVQYKLPHFQREYAWEKNNWKMFFDDVMSMYDDRSGTPSKHFLGTIVVMTDGTHGISMIVHKIVDGQQRLITASLLLCALRNSISPERNSISPEQKLFDEINSYLINPREDGDFYFKLVPTVRYGDKRAYFSILRDQFNGSSESKITTAYKYFRKRISDKNQLDLERFVKCIVAGMEVVFVKLAENEQPYKIFESLNAKGKALTQPDLVRNYIAMRLPTSGQEQVFDNYWIGIEQTLQERRKTVRGMGELTAFLRHYLSYNSGQLPTAKRVYETFRNRMETEFSSVDQFIEEIEVIHQFSRYYNKLLRPQNEPNGEIQDQLIRLNTLAFSSPYPFLMYLYDLYAKNSISSDEFLKTLKAIENHVVRRFLAGESTPYLHNMFATLKSDVDKNRISQTTTDALLNKKYPSDHRLRRELFSTRFYHIKYPRRAVIVLETLNRHLSKDTDGHTVLDGESTIEHILPQKLSKEWEEHLGISWEEDHEIYCDTIGNVTILTKKWNSSLSDSEFHKKKSKLAQHGLLLNSNYFSQDIAKWNADAIRERTKYLTDLILEVWPALGEQPEPDSVTGTKPTSLTILDESFNVKTWQEVAIQTAQTISGLAGAEEFESLAGKFNKDFKRECLDDKAYKKMPNGWCLRVRRSAEDVVRFCKKLVTSAGLSEKDWDVKYE